MNAADIMTRFPATASPDTPIADLVHLMADRDVAALPIVVDGRLVGLVTHSDIIRALASREGATAGADGRRPPPARRLRCCGVAPTLGGPGEHPTCMVDAGDIHLWGPVESEADQRALLALARSLPGARGVTDHMTVLPQGDPFDRPNWPVPERP